MVIKQAHRVSLLVRVVLVVVLLRPKMVVIIGMVAAVVGLVVFLGGLLHKERLCLWRAVEVAEALHALLMARVFLVGLVAALLGK
jgi:hypothetical protein